MPKILLAAHDGSIGGAHNALHLLLVSLRGADVKPIVPFPAEGPATEGSRDAGFFPV